MMTKQILLAMMVGMVCQMPRPVQSHGRLWEPPGRSTMWRRGFKTTPNYQDHELNCGGFQHQLQQGYKCGLCGDPYDGVRENEAGGKYATGLISRTYSRGQTVNFEVQMTANHKGYFEFSICSKNKFWVKETQKCFDLHPLTLADGSGTRYYPGTRNGMIKVAIKLPPSLTCDYCVLQWKYHTGNRWGTDPDGRSCVGCGPQEEFYGCADIRILP